MKEKPEVNKVGYLQEVDVFWDKGDIEGHPWWSSG